MQPVTVFSTFNQSEAQIIRSRLEVAGFNPVVINENSTITLGGFSKSTTIHVEVPEDEAADVKEFLDTPVTPAE